MPYKNKEARNAAESLRKWIEYGPEIREQKRNYNRQLRKEVITAYGGQCVLCGEDDPIVLVIDHIYNDGAKERATGTPFYGKLKKLGFPRDRYQLLCHNCNWRKEVVRRTNKVEGLYSYDTE